MSMTPTTLIVLAANGITAIWCAALLMLVVWQAPHQRANQYFGVAMLTLGSYVVANALGRFIDELSLDATDTTYLAVTIYGVFVVSMFYFASEFAQHATTVTRFMRLIGLILVAVQAWRSGRTTCWSTSCRPPAITAVIMADGPPRDASPGPTR